MIRFVESRWDQGDHGLAEIAHHLLKDVIKCDERCQTFYYFDKALTAWRCGKKEDLRIYISHALEDSLHDVVAHLECSGSCEFTLGSQEGPVISSTLLKERAEQLALLKKQRALRVIKYLQKNSGMTNIVTAAAPLFIDTAFKLDQIPYLLGVKNGVVDLRTGELRECKPEDGIYRILDIEYDPQASIQLMQDTVMTIMADDPVMTEYLQKVLGYGVTGEVSEEAAFVFTSNTGRAGRGVITQLLMNIMGPFYTEMNPALIVNRPVSNMNAEWGKLVGSRVAVFNGVNSDEKLNTNKLQLISGSDCISVKPDPIIPRHLCIIVTNSMPQLTKVTPDIQQRLICIKFPVTFVDLASGEQPTKTKRHRDNQLKARLAADKQGVLRWLVEGSMKWYASRDLKWKMPPQVREMTDSYFCDQDV
jgi:P4 family phage/plasmid primase-like protien